MLFRYILFKYLEYSNDPIAAMRDSDAGTLIEIASPEDLPDEIKEKFNRMSACFCCDEDNEEDPPIEH